MTFPNSESTHVDFEEHKLDNGLQILLCPLRRIPLVHVSLHYRIGSSHEQKGKSGLAHLFEHMMFQGSKSVGKNEHGRLVDDVGGRWNASTNKDRTNYYETVPSHCLELALWLEAERLQNLAVTEANFENQRKTVIEEKKQNYDNRPYGRSLLRFDDLAYENWAYAHPIIGTDQDLENLTLEDARTFHQLHYGPDRATLVLAGNFDSSESLQLIDRHFAGILDHTNAENPDLDEPPQEEEKREIQSDRLATVPAVSMGYQAPPVFHPTTDILTLLGLILSYGDSARFNREFIHRRNWLHGLAIWPNSYRGSQLFRFSFQAQQGVDVTTLLRKLDEELLRLTQDLVSQAELERARNQALYGLISNRSTATAIGETLAYFALYFDDAKKINSQMDRFLDISREDIRQVAGEILRPERRTVLITLPEGQ